MDGITSTKRIVLAGFVSALLLLPVRVASQRASASQSADTLLQRATAAYLEARYPEAVKLLSGIPADSLSPGGLFTLGSALAAMNESERAVQLLRKALEREPGRIAFQYQLARTLSSLGMSQEAEEEYG